MKISVVIPAYNERESLAKLHSELVDILDRFGLGYEIICVDDGSTDGTGECARELGMSVRRIDHLGKTAAYRAGFAGVSGDIILTLDADLQDDPTEIPRLFETIDSGADMVVGWKKERHDPCIKVVSSRLFNFFVRRLTGTPVHDVNCGLRAFRREVVSCFDLTRPGYHRFLPVFAHLAGYKVVELAVHHRPRYAGESKYGATGLRRAFWGLGDLIRIYRSYGRDRKQSV